MYAGLPPALVPGGPWAPAVTLGSGVSATGGAAASLDLAAAALRHAPLLLLVALQLWAAGVGGAETAGAEGESEACTKTLGFNESLVPKDRAFQDLLTCDEHHKRTCCERNDTIKVRSAWLGFAVERSSRCARMGQLAFCSLCDGDVGVGLKSAVNTILLCPSFCRQWYEACVEDFFAPATSGLQACGPSAVVCSPLGEITESAAEFCASLPAPSGASFAVAGSDLEPDGCFDGVPAARSRGAGPKAPWVRPARPLPPWWRRFWPRHVDVDLLLLQVKRQAPGVIIALVAVFFAWYVWFSRDSD